jgi:hypothetical protein
MDDQVEEIHADLEKFLGVVVVSLATNLTNDLREATPKKTGYAQSNWLPNVGTTLDSPVGSKESPSYGAQFARIRALDSYHVSRGAIFITNNVYYVVTHLDRGTSPQAQAGFIQATLEKTVERVIQPGVSFDT